MANPKHKPKLKPCPFCGGNNLGIFQYKLVTDTSIRCSDCGGSVAGESGKYLTVGSVVKVWNKRDKANG